MPPTRTDLDLAFATPGRVFRSDDGERIAVRVESLGEIDLEGLAIGDPLASELTIVAPPAGPIRGRGRVELAIARWSEDERVAAARVVLTETPVVQWIEADAVLGVDAGMMAFASARAAPGLATEAVSEELLAQLDANDRQVGWTSARVAVDGHAVVAFSSGYGDGIYASYWGLDAQGEVAALAIDFDVLIGQVFERFVVARPRGRGRVKSAELKARGVTLRVPWLAPQWLVVRGGGLPAPHRVYVRLTREGDEVDRWIRHHFIAGPDRRWFRIDLREVPADAALAVRIVRGHQSLPLA